MKKTLKKEKGLYKKLHSFLSSSTDTPLINGPYQDFNPNQDWTQTMQIKNDMKTFYSIGSQIYIHI